MKIAEKLKKAKEKKQALENTIKKKAKKETSYEKMKAAIKEASKPVVHRAHPPPQKKRKKEIVEGGL